MPKSSHDLKCLWCRPPPLFMVVISWKCLAVSVLDPLHFIYYSSVFFFSPSCSLFSTGSSWMQDLHTQLCIYISGQQTSWMAQVWSPSTVNVTLRVSISSFSTKNLICISDSLVAVLLLEMWLLQVCNLSCSHLSINTHIYILALAFVWCFHSYLSLADNNH